MSYEQKVWVVCGMDGEYIDSIWGIYSTRRKAQARAKALKNGKTKAKESHSNVKIFRLWIDMNCWIQNPLGPYM